MLCRDIHCEHGGCEQEMPQPDKSKERWSFCPLCGRVVGHIPDLDGEITVPLNKEEIRFLTIKNSGWIPVKADLSLEPQVAGLWFYRDDGSNVLIDPNDPLKACATINSEAPMLVAIHVPPITQSRVLGYMRVIAKDGWLDGNPWRIREARTREFSVRIHARVDTGHVRVVQEILIFREGTKERTLDLVNEGTGTVKVVFDGLPVGYEISQHEFMLHGGERQTVSVRRRFETPVDEKSELVVTLFDKVKPSDKITQSVILQSEKPGKALPAIHAIIGVDFGTAFTSISFRECRPNTDMNDDVEFLRLPRNGGVDRFPTRLWIGRRDSTVVIGSQATEMYKADPKAGFLFREIKSLLRDQNDLKMHPETTEIRRSAIGVLVERYGENWAESLVTEYLSRLYVDVILPELHLRFHTEDVSVRYVFSLPVLDYASDEKPMYNEHKAAMQRCIANAGFPLRRVEFQFEPVCASLGLLYPPKSKKWPHLGTKGCPVDPGSTIAVFDSGGGTTDISLAKAEVSEDGGRVSLRIEKCLGVGTHAETFGGELVTTGIVEALRDPKSIDGDASWYKGAVNLETILREDAKDDLRIRDSAEGLKTELAPSGAKPVTRKDDQGNETTIRPSLLTRLVLPHLESLARELIERVFTAIARDKVTYYLCVGGNTYLSAIERWVGEFMKDSDPEHSRRRLRIPEGDRKYAVAYGAVWVPTARIRNAVPYDMELISDVDDEPIIRFRRNTSQETYPTRRAYEVPALGQVDFDLKVAIGKDEFRIAAGSAFNSLDVRTNVETVTDLQNGMVRVVYWVVNPDKEDQDAQQHTVLEYQL